MSAVLDQLRISAKRLRRSVIFPESSDDRVIEAAKLFAQQNLGTAVLLNPPEDFEPGYQLQAIRSEEVIEECAAVLFEARRHRGMTVEQAVEELQNPLLVAAILVRTGYVHAAVAGSVASTSDVLRAGLRGIGTDRKGGLVSSFFLMDFNEETLTYADCGVVPEPDDEQLAQIAINAADNHLRLTNDPPLVAMLSFSTLGSASHPSVERVQRATALIRQQRPDIEVEGELQFDAAFVPDVAKRKAPHSRVAGHANVFVFPSLDAGNIAYKITQRLGGARAIGPVVQGLARPMMDLSRGCSVEDVVDVAVIAANLA